MHYWCWFVFTVGNYCYHSKRNFASFQAIRIYTEYIPFKLLVNIERHRHFVQHICFSIVGMRVKFTLPPLPHQTSIRQMLPKYHILDVWQSSASRTCNIICYNPVEVLSPKMKYFTFQLFLFSAACKLFLSKTTVSKMPGDEMRKKKKITLVIVGGC